MQKNLNVISTQNIQETPIFIELLTDCVLSAAASSVPDVPDVLELGVTFL